MRDEVFIRECLKLAKRGSGWTNPNPMVGAVLVKNGKIIGKGYHKKVGLPHAEIEALNHAKTSLKDTTLYINLEPCTHFGRTPPCVKTIIKSGIKRVVCSTLDPNPRVNGKGVAILQKAGIEVSVGLLTEETERLNEAFFTFHKKKRPFIAIKFAASLDGKIATFTGDSKWITNEKARKFTMSLWSEYQSVLIGINTVLKDNEPMRLIRTKGKNPLRIILDSSLRTPLDSQILWNKEVIIATVKSKEDKEKKTKLKNTGVTILSFPPPKISLKVLLQELYKREIISILVEGGGKTLGSFVDAKLVDKVYAFHTPIIIGGERGITAVGGEGIGTIAEAIKLQDVTFRRFGDNILTIGYVR